MIVHLYSGSFLESDQSQGAGDKRGALGDDSFLEKEAMLVYPGKFQSMDGEVEITDEHVAKLADTHNSLLSKVKRMATGEIPLRDCPPVQLDHQPTAVNTVGRVIGELSVRDAEIEGQNVKALFGKVRILGRENVEKVRDGRWIHLSIGADLEKGKLNELTITPFPAASQAAMLGKRVGKFMTAKGLCRLSKEVKYRNAIIFTTEFADGKWQSKVPKEFLHGEPYFHGATEKDVIGMAKQAIDEYLSHTNQISFSGPKLDKPFAELTRDLSATAKMMSSIRLADRKVNAFTYKGYTCSLYETEGPTKFGLLYSAEVDGKAWMNGRQYYSSKEDAIAAVKSVIDSDESRMSEVPPEPKLSEGDDMDKAKMKKHLMDKTKCSDAEADEKLAGMSPEECSLLAAEADEAEKKMAADKEEADKKLAEEKPEEEKKTEEEKKEKLSAKKAKVVALAKEFRTGISGVQLASRKANIVARLSALRGAAKITPAEVKKSFSDEQLTKLAAQSDDAIESVLKTYASREPVVDVQQYGSARAEDVAQIAQRIKSSELTKETLEGMEFTKKAVGKKFTEGPTPNPDNQPFSRMEDGGGDDMPDFEASMTEFGTMYASGKKEEAILALKEKLKKMKTRNTGDNIEQFPLAQDQEKQMSALAESIKRLQNQFEELLSMVSPEMGIGDADLK